MERKINIGDKVICNESGVSGTVIRFYTPTSCEEQTMVKTKDGREYHAPTRTWMPNKSNNMNELITTFMGTNDSKMLNSYGEYVVEFAKNHNISISKAVEEPMVKARLDYFNATGR